MAKEIDDRLTAEERYRIQYSIPKDGAAKDDWLETRFKQEILNAVMTDRKCAFLYTEFVIGYMDPKHTRDAIGVFYNDWKKRVTEVSTELRAQIENELTSW